MVHQGISLSQDISLRQEQIIAPHQIQSLEILAIPLMDLQARVNQEMQENPTLERLDSESEQLVGDPMEEMDAPRANDDAMAGEVAEKDEFLANLMQLDDSWRDYITPSHARQYASTDDDEKRRHFFDSLTTEKTLSEELMEQVRMSEVDDQTALLAELVIGSIDDIGYLRITPEDLAQTANAELSAVQKAINLVQSFEPPGIAARDLRECLLLQLKHDGRQDTLAYRLVSKHLEDVSRNKIPQVARALGVSTAAIYEVMTEIKQLQPRPGNFVESANIQYVLPELAIEIDEQGQYVVKSNRNHLPNIRISAHYREILEDPNVTKEVKAYVRDKIIGGNLLIKSIAQRQSTLERIGNVLIDKQREFLDEGPESLRPLTMSQVADEIEVHETTVSRAIANKYVQTPRGLFPLKFFFTGGYETEDGEQLSSHSVKHKIQSLIAEENPRKPLSDQKIVKMLDEDGVDVARRTVAKYREELGIPSSHLRKSHTA